MKTNNIPKKSNWGGKLTKRIIGMVISVAMLTSVGTTVMAEDVGSVFAEGVEPRNAGVCPRCNMSTTISIWEQIDEIGYVSCIYGKAHKDLELEKRRYYSEKCPKPDCRYEFNNVTLLRTIYRCYIDYKGEIS